MPSPVFIDANVPIYAAGGAHPFKEPCVEVLVLVGIRPSAFLTDAEVLQELVHIYLARNQWAGGRGVLDRFAELMRGRIEPMYADDVRAASRLADRHRQLSARDLIHLAVMQRVGANQIVSADRGFDAIADLQRLDPADVASWRGRIVAF